MVQEDTQAKRMRQMLLQIDPNDDELWTADGAPRVEVVANLIQNPDLRRSDITAAAPDFDRDMARKLRDEGVVVDADQVQDIALDEDDDDDSPSDTPDPAPPEAGDEGGATIMSRPFADVLRDPELCAEAVAHVEGRLRVLNKERATLDVEIDKLNTQSQFLCAQRDRLERADPNRNQREIHAALNASQEARAKRVAAAQAFIKAGTSPQDVAQQLDGRAPIDKALARKSGHGVGRPDYPVRAGV